MKCVVSDTGPMLSVFQAEQTKLLLSLYDRLYIPSGALPEYIKHKAQAELDELIRLKFVTVCELAKSEKGLAWQIAQEIAKHPLTKDKLAQNHYAEAEAMVLMNRPDLDAVEMLVDELAAREIAKKRGIPFVGFAGILIRACKTKQIEPEQVRFILLKCQSLGTHYATEFIEGIYSRLKRELP